MLSEEDNGLSQTKLVLAFLFFFAVALCCWPLLDLHSKIFLYFLPKQDFPTNLEIQEVTAASRNLCCPKPANRLSQYYRMLWATGKLLFDQMLLQSRKTDYSLYFGSTETFHNIVIPKEIQKFICQKTLQLNGVKHQLCPCLAI